MRKKVKHTKSRGSTLLKPLMLTPLVILVILLVILPIICDVVVPIIALLSTLIILSNIQVVNRLA